LASATLTLCTVLYTVGEVDFWIFWIFDIQQLNFGDEKKVTAEGPKFSFFFKWINMGIKNSLQF
jgi:hypothetical protein